MISSRAVMANEVSLEVVIDAQVEALENFDMHKIHVNVVDIIFFQKVYNFLVISFSTL